MNFFYTYLQNFMSFSLGVTRYGFPAFKVQMNEVFFQSFDKYTHFLLSYFSLFGIMVSLFLFPAIFLMIFGNEAMDKFLIKKYSEFLIFFKKTTGIDVYNSFFSSSFEEVINKLNKGSIIYREKVDLFNINSFNQYNKVFKTCLIYFSFFIFGIILFHVEKGVFENDFIFHWNFILPSLLGVFLVEKIKKINRSSLSFLNFFFRVQNASINNYYWRGVFFSGTTNFIIIVGFLLSFILVGSFLNWGKDEFSIFRIFFIISSAYYTIVSAHYTKVCDVIGDSLLTIVKKNNKEENLADLGDKLGDLESDALMGKIAYLSVICSIISNILNTDQDIINLFIRVLMYSFSAFPILIIGSGIINSKFLNRNLLFLKNSNVYIRNIIFLLFLLIIFPKEWVYIVSFGAILFVNQERIIRKKFLNIFSHYASCLLFGLSVAKISLMSFFLSYTETKISLIPLSLIFLFLENSGWIMDVLEDALKHDGYELDILGNAIKCASKNHILMFFERNASSINYLLLGLLPLSTIHFITWSGKSFFNKVNNQAVNLKSFPVKTEEEFVERVLEKTLSNKLLSDTLSLLIFPLNISFANWFVNTGGILDNFKKIGKKHLKKEILNNENHNPFEKNKKEIEDILIGSDLLGDWMKDRFYPEVVCFGAFPYLGIFFLSIFDVIIESIN